MLDAAKHEERDLMILRITTKAKFHQEELRKCQTTLQRLNDLREETPKDKYGDAMQDQDIDKHFSKAKAEFTKIVPQKP